MSLDTAAIMVLEILNSVTILVLLALGLAVIFGMMRIVNLAQGEFFTAGAFTVLAGTRYAHLPLGVAMLLAPFVVAALGIAIERLVIRRLYGRPLDVMLATWGVSLLLIGLITVTFGAVTQGVPFALGNFLIDLFPISDSFDRALSHAPAEALQTDFGQGVAMIRRLEIPGSF